jgi:hypothetical protein
MNLIYCVVSGTIYRLACVMLISCSFTRFSFLDTTFDPEELCRLARHVQRSILFVFTASIIGQMMFITCNYLATIMMVRQKNAEGYF